MSHRLHTYGITAYWLVALASERPGVMSLEFLIYGQNHHLGPRPYHTRMKIVPSYSACKDEFSSGRIFHCAIIIHDLKIFFSAHNDLNTKNDINLRSYCDTNHKITTYIISDHHINSTIVFSRSRRCFNGRLFNCAIIIHHHTPTKHQNLTCR